MSYGGKVDEVFMYKGFFCSLSRVCIDILSKSFTRACFIAHFIKSCSVEF